TFYLICFFWKKSLFSRYFFADIFSISLTKIADWQFTLPYTRLAQACSSGSNGPAKRVPRLPGAARPESADRFCTSHNHRLS
ncbi:hypothetical protein ACJBSW_11420, partial [Streptococcus suis]